MNISVSDMRIGRIAKDLAFFGQPAPSATGAKFDAINFERIDDVEIGFVLVNSVSSAITIFCPESEMTEAPQKLLENSSGHNISSILKW
jgi:hypothetical protein